MKPILAFATASFLGILSLSLPATAQTTIDDLGLTVTATPAVATDYLFRGISQTRNRPAIQLTLDVQHESGLYAGAFATNVAFPNTDARQELDLLAGYRFELGGLSLDVGGVGYLYPGYDKPEGGYDFNYFEAVAKASYTIVPAKLVAMAAYSPDFYFESGSAFYLEGGADFALPLDFTLAGRFGRQWINRNARYGAPDYSTWSAVLSREIVAGITLSVGYYDTDLSKAECFAGTKFCEARALVMLSKVF